MSFSFLKKNKQAGFAVIYAVVISSFIILIGSSLFSTSIKQIILNSAKTNSAKVFYIADAGIECALYYELYQGGTENNTFYDCFNSTYPVSNIDVDKYLIEFSSTAIGDGCGQILVRKNVPRNVEGSPVNTTEVISRGFNSCIGNNPDFTNPLIVERRMRAWFID